VDNIFSQPHTTSVRAYGFAEPGSHKEDREYLADTSEMTRVNLNDIDCVRLKELLKHDAIVCVFAGGNADAVQFELAPDTGMFEDAVDCVSFCVIIGSGKKKR